MRTGTIFALKRKQEKVYKYLVTILQVVTIVSYHEKLFITDLLEGKSLKNCNKQDLSQG